MGECYITEDGVGLAFIIIKAFNILFQNWRSGRNGLYHKKERFLLKLIKEKIKRCSTPNPLIDKEKANRHGEYLV